jgi:hypothetical protein
MSNFQDFEGWTLRELQDEAKRQGVHVEPREPKPAEAIPVSALQEQAEELYPTLRKRQQRK